MFSLFGGGGMSGSLFEPAHLVHTDPASGNKIYLGNFIAANDETFLADKKIKFVLTVASGLNIRVKDKSIEHKVIQAYDLPTFNLAQFFEETYNWMDSRMEKGNIFVHCAAGVSRSTSTIIAYLIRKFGWDFEHSLAYIKEKRKIVCPNDGFRKQLKEYEVKYRK